METLYKRLGGYDAIAAVIDETFRRKIADKQLGRFFVGTSADTRKKIRQRVVELLCNATGGPCFYTGRDLKIAHTGLNITESDWQIAVGMIIDILKEFNVPEQEKGDVLAALSGLKKDIVGI